MRTLAATAVLFVATSAASFAGEAVDSVVSEARSGCFFSARVEALAGPVATLSAVEGQVVRSGDTGFSPVSSGASINVGDRIVLIDGARATVEAGGSSKNVAAPAVLDVTSDGKTACLALQSGVRTFAQGQPAPSGAGFPAWAPAAAVGGAVVVGVAVVAATDDDDNERAVSP